MDSDAPDLKERAAKKIAEILALEEQQRLAEESPPEELKEIFRLIDYEVLPILGASGVVITREELTRMFAEWFVRRGTVTREDAQSVLENVEPQVNEPSRGSSRGRRLLSTLSRSGGPFRRFLRIAGMVIMLVPLVLVPVYFFVSTQLPPPEAFVSTQLPPPEARGVMTIAPAIPLIAPGQTQNYTVLTLSQPASGSTLTTILTAYSTQGLSFEISQTQVPAQATAIIPVAIRTSASLAPGKYEVTVEEKVGSSVRNQTFAVNVVPALVVMEHLTFVPQHLTVPKGTTVYWLNLDSMIGCCDPGIHNAVFTAGMSVRSPNLGTHDTWSFQFENTGDFYYICSIHPYMTGEVSVSA
jgi:plastocyanin